MDDGIAGRLDAVEKQLRRFAVVMDPLGRDLRRPVAAARDGYYEASLTNAGAVIEAMLRDVWKRVGIKGEASRKTVEQLFSVVKDQIEMDRLVQDYVRDIQLVRNRAAHGEEVGVEDCIEALRKLSVVLDWYVRTHVGADPVASAPRAPDHAGEAGRPQDALHAAATASLPPLAERLVSDALAADASEIHLVAAEGDYRVRRRVGRRFHEAGRLDRAEAGAVIRSLRASAGADSPAGRPGPEGTLTVKVEPSGTPVRLRVSLAPGEFGELCVLRVIRVADVLRLDDLGQPADVARTLRRWARAPRGLFVMAGLPGSGKTTTVLALLDALDRDGLSIHLIGDSREEEQDGTRFDVPGVHRIVLDRARGRQLAEVVRSTMDMRPDVLATLTDVGPDEMRQVIDAARSAAFLVQVEAASACDAIRKLQAVGSEHLQAALECVAAQVLVRPLCPNCARPDAESTRALRSAGIVDADQATARVADGCDHCGGTGRASQRLAVIEVAPLTATLKEKLGAGMSATELKNEAVKAGMRTLRQAGLALVREGRVALDEVLAGTPADD